MGSAAVDYLVTRPDVDQRRIGVMDGRWRLLRSTSRRRLAREGDRPVPHYSRFRAEVTHPQESRSHSSSRNVNAAHTRL